MNQPLTSVSTMRLIDELCARMLRLEHAATRVRSVGRLRAVVDEAYRAGCAAGQVAALTQVGLRLRLAIDGAIEKAPPAPPAEDTLGTVVFEREYRRALFEAVTQLQKDVQELERNQQAGAGVSRAKLAAMTDDALEPEPSLRVRAGRWLYDIGNRLSARGASAAGGAA